MKRLRVYVDTSVIGGCLDEEVEKESRALIDLAHRGEITILASDLLLDELRDAPLEVGEVFRSLPAGAVEHVPTSPESIALQEQYLAENVVGRGSKDDALHVALAVTARADVMVSWNFKHILQFNRIRGFNSVNLVQGYPMIEIRSPKEMIQS
ncbi:MAG: PIN domain-containing protein [Candidatus Sumerlaeota bacterium]|nr:PIN domain-containing protein [Candidatus Sumerlaeota bacterium]